MLANTLKEYMYRVYQLEGSLYQQQVSANSLNQEINRLKNREDREFLGKPKKQSLISDDGFRRFIALFWTAVGLLFFIGYVQKTEIFSDWILLLLLIPCAVIIWKVSCAFADFFVCGLFGIVIGIIISLCIGFFFADKYSWTWDGIITFGAKIGCVVGFLIGGAAILLNIRKDKQNLSEIAVQNQQIEAQNENERAYAQRKITLLEQELAALNHMMSETKQVLDTYYRQDIIYPKYRNLIAVSSFYEYLSSGRCTHLEGHEGAYNIFENEIRQNWIINKLDEVIDRLDRIEDHQYMLYSAIQESNSKTAILSQQLDQCASSLQGIEENAAITAYNSHITAQNTEFLKWVEVLR